LTRTGMTGAGVIELMRRNARLVAPRPHAPDEGA